MGTTTNNLDLYQPAFGEEGYDDEVGENFAVLDAHTNGWINVMSHGAVGDNVTDDTVAIQAALNAAGASANGRYGVVFFPEGRYLVTSTLTINRGISLIGVGHQNSSNSPFGGSYAAGGGSWLRSTVTSGAAIHIDPTSYYNAMRIEKLGIVGPGTGTSIGIHFDSDDSPLIGVVNAWVQDVMVMNFATGYYLDFVEDSTFIKAATRGSKIGFHLYNNTNQNVFINTEVQFAEEYAIKLDSDGGPNVNNIWTGGLIQNVNGPYGIYIGSGGNQYGQIFDCWHIEGNTDGLSKNIIEDGAGWGTFRNMSFTKSGPNPAAVWTVAINGSFSMFDGIQGGPRITCSAESSANIIMRVTDLGTNPPVDSSTNGNICLCGLGGGTVGGLRVTGERASFGELALANGEAATEVIGKAVVKKIRIYDVNGSALGYIPVYSSIS